LWLEQYRGTASRPELRVETSELPGLGLLDLLEGAQAAVLVDAVHSQSEPGTLLRLENEDLVSFQPDAQSAHGWGVAETLQLGHSLYPSLMKCRIILIGIVGQQFDPGSEISPKVREALDEAAKMIEREVQAQL